MAEQAKRLILAKGHCGTCQSPVSVEVEEPPPTIKVEMAPCKCGLTENVRIVRFLILGFMSIMFALFGSCVSSHYFTNQAIKEMKGQFEVKEKPTQPMDNAIPFEVVPKRPPEEPKK